MSQTTQVEVPEPKNTFDLSIRENPFKRNFCPAIKGDYICIHTSSSSAAYLYSQNTSQVLSGRCFKCTNWTSLNMFQTHKMQTEQYAYIRLEGNLL